MAVRSHVAWIGLIVCGWTAAAAQGAAQAAGPFADGIRAYQNLDFDQAAALLRRAFARASSAAVSERAQGLLYLGAADLFRGRRDSAVAVFRRLVQLDPRYRPDRLVFPPEVTSVFDNVRVESRAVVLVAPPDTEISTGTGAFTFWVVASAFQTVEVTLRYQDGAPFRALYAGPMGDSLRVQWDGLDAAGQMPPVSRILLRVASRISIPCLGPSPQPIRSSCGSAPAVGRRCARCWVACCSEAPSPPCPRSWGAITPTGRAWSWPERSASPVPWGMCCTVPAAPSRRTSRRMRRCAPAGGRAWRP